MKCYLLDILLGIIVPFLGVNFLLSPLIFAGGVPFYGDETYYYYNPNSFYFNPFNWFFQWIPAYGLAPPFLTLFSYNIPLLLLTNLLGQELAVKIFWLIVASLPGILTYFALKILAKEWALLREERGAGLFSLVGALFMLLAFTNAGLGGGATAPAWSYITLPLTFALLVRYLKHGSYKDLLLLCISSLFAIANPFWIYLMLIMVILYLGIEVISIRRDRLTLFKRLMIVALGVLALNMFWLAPVLGGYLLGGGGVFQIYTTEKLISFGGLRFLSHWNLLDVLMVGEHEYHFFWLHPQNYGPLNAIIPILAVASILIFRRNKYVLFTALTLVIGIFLTKGVWEPGGYLYYFIASNLPYGAGAILRNPTKFVPLVTFSYAFLIGFFVAKSYEKLSSLWPKKHISLYRCSKLIPIGGLTLLILSPITYGTLLDLQGYTWPRYKPTYIPQVYNEVNTWISNQEGDFKVMWIPSGGAYVWKPYIITAFPDLLSSRPAVDFRKIYPDLLKSTNNIGKLLKVLGVKYVIFHGDSLDYPNEEILQDLLRQKDLKIVYKSNYTYVPENSKTPLPLGQPNILFSRSPFKLVEPSFLPRGKETEIIIQYVIPEEVVKMGYKGKFWAGFGIGLNGFSAGSVALDKRVFWAGVYEQRMLNETSGYAVFKVKVPYTYPGTAIDIYANFYDGGFKGLTPSYFIARLLVSPREITVPFIVFENEEYNGSIYSSSLALTHGLNLAEILDIEDFDTGALSAVSVDSFPLSHDILDSSQVFIYSNSTFPNWLDNWLANRNTRLVYMMPLDNLNLTAEKPIAGPYEPSYYVYSEKPLTPLSSLVLERGRGTLVNFSYYLPKPVLDEGFKGKFWAGFGIRLWGYPHGVAPAPDVESKYRVFEAFISNFTPIDDFKGYVSFNMTVPRDFGGTEIDVYANFYDGVFRSISPIYFLGTFKVKGTTLVKTDDGHPELHMVYDSLPIDLYIPRNGNYVLAVRARGTLSVNSTSLRCDGNWAYINFSRMERGHHVMVLSTDSETYIRNLVMFSLDREVDGLAQVFKGETARLLDYRQISPVEWEATFNASSPFISVFTEPFDGLWRAYVNGKEISPVPLYGMVNGFQINETGLVHIRIYYTLQNYYVIGWSIFAMSLIVFMISYVRGPLIRIRQLRYVFRIK